MLRRSVFVIGVIAGIAACSPNALEPADTSNEVDTFTMGALDGSLLRDPSAFDITLGLPVRTDQTSGFDFIYNVDSAGRHVLLPLHAIAGLGVTSGVNPGFIVESTMTFEAITSAPSNNYVTDDTLVITPGEVLIGRSRVACYLGVPQYGKFQILSFDDSARTMQIESLSDINCGYKNLQPGVPTS